MKQENKRQLSSQFCDCPIIFTKEKKNVRKTPAKTLKTSFLKYLFPKVLDVSPSKNMAFRKPISLAASI